MKTAIIIVIVLVVGAVVYLNYMQPGLTNERENTSPNNKINLTAVCDGALAYMTFLSGAAADVWVRECKEGKHPEAVDEWKQRQGITDDRAI